jgi:hypothetical protein
MFVAAFVVAFLSSAVVLFTAFYVSSDSNSPRFVVNSASHPFNPVLRDVRTSSRKLQVLKQPENMVAQVDEGGFRFRLPNGTLLENVFLDGTNLGNTIPGYFIGDWMVSYDDFIRYLQYTEELGMWCIRVYDIMQPAFYRAVSHFNRGRQQPIYVIQGIYFPEDVVMERSAANNGAGADVWVDDIATPFINVIRKTVRAVHGDIPGEYEDNISDWVIAWIIGSEWDPAIVSYTNNAHLGQRFPLLQGSGLYVSVVESANPFESWLGYMMDVTAATDAAYGCQRPLGFMNWPSTDPLRHPSEPRQDTATVDAVHVLNSQLWTAGVFATYNAYPYWPDFLTHSEYKSFSDPFAEYLRQLKEYHTGIMPLFISEVGLTTSVASARFGLNGRHHGKLSEEDQGKHVAAMMSAVRDLKYCGVLQFSLVDQWHKSTWNIHHMKVPTANRARWLNVLSPEERYGLVAADPAESLTMDGTFLDWAKPVTARFPVVSSPSRRLSVTNDEAYLYLKLQLNVEAQAPVYVLFASNAGRGSSAPVLHRQGVASAIGTPTATSRLRFTHVLVFAPTTMTSEFFVHSSVDDFHARVGWDIGYTAPLGPDDFSIFTLAANDMFIDAVLKQTDISKPDQLGYMKRGSGNLDLWNFGPQGYEARLPWNFLGISDPSTSPPMSFYVNGTRETAVTAYEPLTNGFRIVLAEDPLPIEDGNVLEYTWSGWETPLFRERKKTSFGILKAWAASIRNSTLGAKDSNAPAVDEGEGDQQRPPSTPDLPVVPSNWSVATQSKSSAFATHEVPWHVLLLFFLLFSGQFA